MKRARVKPLFKKNSRSEVGNYRPVSILCIVSKILEKAVYSQLEKFLVKNNMLYEFQSGFRGNYSTDSCLVHLTDHIKAQTANGLYTGMVMIDLQKAFDTVDHEILCDKLKVMGVGSVEWFKSYLQNRSQMVHVNDTDSDYMDITCGVPQGSILGPLLFLCYVNDMRLSISSECKLILYADDSAILFSHTNADVISHRLGTELESCSRWLVDNRLSLHLGKTESILFGSKRKLGKIKCFNVQCNGQLIKSQLSVKYLGLVLDKYLSGEAIVNSIVNKVNAKLKFLYRQRNFLDMNLRKLLCNSLIQCHFDYSCSSWYNGISKLLQKKLQIMQNKVVRYINDYGPRTSIRCSDLTNIGYLKTESRVKQLMLNHVHKIYNQTCPSYLSEHFVRVTDIHNHRTRSSSYNFHVPRVCGVSSSTFFLQWDPYLECFA